MKNYLLTRIITAALFTAVLAGTWDAWWHGALGRESFWSPPHILLYSAIITAVSLGLYGWRKFKDAVWRNFAIALLLIPATAPIDDIWHRTFGIETVASPLIVWSPPHLILIGTIIWAFVQCLKRLKEDPDMHAKWLFGNFIFAGIANLLFFVAAPVQPLGPYKLLGFWGAGILCAIMVVIFLFSERVLARIGTALSVSAMIILIQSIEFGEKISSKVVVPPHGHAPGWLIIFSYLLAALWIDLTRDRLPMWFRGGIAGTLSCVALYGFVNYFLEFSFRFSSLNLLQAIISSAILGIFVGEIASRYKNLQGLLTQ